MTPRDWSRLRDLLDRACPPGIDPLLWRRCREAVLTEAAPPRPAPAFALRHLEIDPFL
jgi:hypothetical protein